MLCQSRRFTEWFWIALTYMHTMEDGTVHRHGLQLSTNTVGTLESVVWLNGHMFEMKSVLTITFVNMTSNHSTVLLPGQQKLIPAPHTKYEITSEDGNVQLEYFPRGVLPTEINTPLAYGSFYHSYGVYRGTVMVGPSAGFRLSKPVAGIFEDHSVNW